MSRERGIIGRRNRKSRITKESNRQRGSTKRKAYKYIE